MNGTAWRQAREAADYTIEDAARKVRDELGPQSLSRSKLQRLETEDAYVDITILAVLADTYGKPVSEIDPTLAGRFSSVRDVLIRTSRCLSEVAA